LIKCIIQLTARPSSLGNPHGLSARDALGLSDAGVQVLASLVNRVGPGALVVWKAIVSKPIHSVRYAPVLWQDPGSPCVDVTDGLALERRAPDPVAHPANVSLDFGTSSSDTGVVGNTSRAATVQILRSDADANDPVGKGTAELTSTADECVELVLVHGATGTGPEAYKERCVGVDGGLESRDGVGGGSALDRCVETGGVEARSSGEALGLVEKANEVIVSAA
jgi:hypothetical protein